MRRLLSVAVVAGVAFAAIPSHALAQGAPDDPYDPIVCESRTGGVEPSVAPKTRKVKPGKAAKFRVRVTNARTWCPVGVTNPIKVCVKANKSARKALKLPKCVSLPGIAYQGSRPARFRIKAKGSAAGKYKVTFIVKEKAFGGKAVVQGKAKATIRVS